MTFRELLQYLGTFADSRFLRVFEASQRERGITDEEDVSRWAHHAIMAARQDLETRALHLDERAADLGRALDTLADAVARLIRAASARQFKPNMPAGDA